MGQGSSHPDITRNVRNLDPLSKVGKTKSMKVTLLTARERAELVARSLNEQRQIRSEKEKLNDIVAMQELQAREAMMAQSGQTYNPPLEGCVSGDDWNRYVDHLWGQEKRSVIHTIVLPKGRNPKDISFYKPRLLKANRYVCPPGDLPTTVNAPRPTFEAYVDPDCAKVETGKGNTIPNHFLVVDARLPEKTMRIARQITEELEEQGKLPHQIRRASREASQKESEPQRESAPQAEAAH